MTPGDRWTALRDYLARSETETTEAAALYDDKADPGAARFRAEALGYRRALEKMTELEAGK
jgi:hypothetical protein